MKVKTKVNLYCTDNSGVGLHMLILEYLLWKKEILYKYIYLLMLYFIKHSKDYTINMKTTEISCEPKYCTKFVKSYKQQNRFRHILVFYAQSVYIK